MADIRNPQATDLQQAVAGLGYLVTGTMKGTSSLNGVPNNLLMRQLGIYGSQVDHNEMVYPQQGFDLGRIFGMGQNSDPQPKGARDKLKEISSSIRSGQPMPNGAMPNSDDIKALESAMYYGGLNVTIDGNINSTEKDILEEFSQEFLDTDATLAGVQTVNVEEANAEDAAAAQAEADRQAAAAKAEADRVAAEQAEIALQAQLAQDQQFRDIRFDAGLVYSGYLDPSKIGDLGARHQAMWDLLIDHQYEVIGDGKDVDSLMRDYFGADGKSPISDEGIAQMRALTDDSDALPPEFKAHLESGDPQLVALAQQYMMVKGHDIAPEEIGTLTENTFNTANQMLQADITVPSTIYYQQGGGLNYGRINILANSGQLVLPNEADLAKYLSPEEIADLEYVPNDFMTREQYIATAMLDSTDGTPATYEQFIADYNASNASAEVNATPVSLEAIANENLGVPTAVATSSVAAVDLPANMTQVLADHALANGGYVDPRTLPMLVDQAQGVVHDGTTFITAENSLINGNIPPELVYTPVKLDPADPAYAQNMELLLKQAYVMENPGAVTYDTIPADVTASLQTASIAQSTLSASLGTGQLDQTGLPSDIVTRLKAEYGDNTVALDQVTAFMSQNYPRELGRWVVPDNPIGGLDEMGVYNSDAPADIQRLVNEGVDFSNPADIQATMMLATGMTDKGWADGYASDGTIIKQAYAVPGASATMMAAVEGQLGLDASNFGPEIQTAYEQLQLPAGATPADPAVAAGPGNNGEDLLSPTNVETTSDQVIAQNLEDMKIVQAGFWPFGGLTLPQGSVTPNVNTSNSFEQSAGMIQMPELITDIDMGIQGPGNRPNADMGGFDMKLPF